MVARPGGVLESPYSPGSIPIVLAGRSREQIIIKQKMALLHSGLRRPGPLLAFYGQRGVGKTSLLRTEYDHAYDLHVRLWVTANPKRRLAADLLAALEREAQQHSGANDSVGDRAKELLKRIKAVRLEIGVPGAKVGVDAETSSAAPEGRPSTVESILRDAADFNDGEDSFAGVVVFVDELQDMHRDDLRDLLVAAQHFDGEGVPVAVIAAGLPSMMGAVMDAATFSERAEFHEIGLLSDVAVYEALQLPPAGRYGGVQWSAGALRTAIPAAAGYPQHVQLIGRETWNVARPTGPEFVILEEHARRGVEAARAHMDGVFAMRWLRLSPEQRRFVTAMASVTAPVQQVGDSTFEPPVVRSQVSDALGVDTRAISRVRKELIDRGIIESPRHGELRFTIPGFAAWVRASAEDLDDL